MQPGLDFILSGPLSRGLPAFVPVSLLYGIPDDAVAEIMYLESKGYPILGVELGEEPDGQFVLPEMTPSYSRNGPRRGINLTRR